MVPEIHPVHSTTREAYATLHFKVFSKSWAGRLGVENAL